MHGTYTHRITCNLHPDQYFKLAHTARQFNSRLAPFVRDAALAYLDRKSFLPQELTQKLGGSIHEIRQVGGHLHQIAERANNYQRLTHDDLRKSGQLVILLQRQMTVLHHLLQSLPHDRQVDGA